MKDLQTVVQSCIVILVSYLVVNNFTSGGMFDDFIRCRIVVLSQYLRVPLDGDETLLYQVILKNWRICRQDDTTIAFLHPVAQ